MQAAARSEILFVRPGRSALEWLASTVAELKGGDPLAPVAVIVPNRNAGREARWRLARSGGYANVRALLLRDLAAEIIRSFPGRQPLTSVVEASAVRAAVAAAGGPLRAVAHHPSTLEALTGLFRELRRQEVVVEAVLAGDHSPIAQAALASYVEFRRITEPYDDWTDLRLAAETHLARHDQAPSELAMLGPIVLFLPTRLDPVDVRLLATTARLASVRAGFSWLGDPLDRGDRESVATAGVLADALALPHPGRSDAQPVAAPAELRVIRAPDPAEEVREVVRCIAGDLEGGVSLHRITVLYRQAAPYASLLREALDLAGLPWSALDGRPLAETRPGRALLTLLRLPERKFAREAVMGWVDTAPLLPDSPRPLRASLWDRLSRGARIVRGAAQWVERLESHAAVLEAQVLQLQREERSPEAGRATWQAENLRSMASIIGKLATALQPPPEARTWGELVDWAEGLRARFASSARRSESEQAEAELVAEELAGLRQADRVLMDDAVTLSVFLDTLQSALEDRRLPVGRLGHGVMVGPVQSVTGLTFEREYLVGMIEGAFPPKPAADPFFPLENQDPLARRERQRVSDRQSFLTALAAGDGGIVTLSTSDSEAGRQAFPSPWLLEAASSVRGGEPLHNSTFQRLKPSENPWLRVVFSAQDGVEGVGQSRPLADLEDRRLREAALWAEEHQLKDHPLARRSDLALDSALRLSRARLGGSLTEFDGNVASLAGTASRIQGLFNGARAISASQVESWAQCPFRYFMNYVLRVEPTERPEESWTINPGERGTLVHEVLAEFFRRLAPAGRPRDDEPYTQADYELLEQIAGKQCERVVARGLTGHPLVWENTRAALLADLRAFLAEDTTWRRQTRLHPAFFEQPFGMGGESWPAVDFEFGGLRLKFRGYIDRVDVDLDGGRAHVFDYKTGSRDPYKEMANDPLAAGQHVQLAVYSHAVRGGLGQLEVGGAYWFVSSKGEFAQVSLPPDRSLTEVRLGEVLEVIGNGIQQGSFPQVPGDEDWDSFAHCKYCAYDRICPAARDELRERKKDDPEARFILQLAPQAGAAR